jgi:hypothetical protein
MKIPNACQRALLGALVLWTSSHSAAADVLVVGPTAGPGIDATQISTAVALALEGDAILVRDGTYTPFEIDGKSLSVIAEGAGARLVAPITFSSSSPCVAVRNLGVDQSVLVRGLKTNTGVSVGSCVGAVWFEDIQTAGATLFCSGAISPGAAYVGSSGRVTFVRCVLLGEVGYEGAFFTGSAPGLQAQSSSVHLFDCALTGGDGVSSTGFISAPTPGAAGLVIDASTVTISGCTIRGGGGGVVAAAPCSNPVAPGGPGVLFVGTAGTMRSLASTAVGGARSLWPLCALTGPAGPAISGTGTIIALPGLARRVRASSMPSSGGALAFTLEGQPGESPVLLVSSEHEPVALWNASLLVGFPPTDVFVLAPLPASGSSIFAIAIPNLGAFGGLAVYAQAVFVAPGPALSLGAGTAVLLR